MKKLTRAQQEVVELLRDGGYITDLPFAKILTNSYGNRSVINKIMFKSLKRLNIIKQHGDKNNYVLKID